MHGAALEKHLGKLLKVSLSFGIEIRRVAAPCSGSLWLAFRSSYSESVAPVLHTVVDLGAAWVAVETRPWVHNDNIRTLSTRIAARCMTCAAGSQRSKRGKGCCRCCSYLKLIKLKLIDAWLQGPEDEEAQAVERAGKAAYERVLAKVRTQWRSRVWLNHLSALHPDLIESLALQTQCRATMHFAVG